MNVELSAPSSLGPDTDANGHDDGVALPSHPTPDWSHLISVGLGVGESGRNHERNPRQGNIAGTSHRQTTVKSLNIGRGYEFTDVFLEVVLVATRLAATASKLEDEPWRPQYSHLPRSKYI